MISLVFTLMFLAPGKIPETPGWGDDLTEMLALVLLFAGMGLQALIAAWKYPVPEAE